MSSRGRGAAVLGLAVLLGVVWTLGSAAEPDTVAFATAGRHLLQGHARAAYADPSVQVGPLMLVLVGALSKLATLVHVSLAPAYGVVASVGTVVLGWFAARRGGDALGGDALGGDAAWPLSLTLLLGGVGWVLVVSGHLEELAVGLLWLVSADAARRGRVTSATVALAAAALCKQSGLLGLPVLLLLPLRRRALGSAGVVLACTVLGYAPSWGSPVWRFRWALRPQSPLTFVLRAGTSFGWPYRLGQALLCLGVGTVVAVLVRRRGADPAAVVVAVLLARLVADPLCLYYYWAPIVAVLLVALTWPDMGLGSWVAAGALGYAFIAPGVVLLGATFRASVLALVLLAAAAVVGLLRHPGGRPPPGRWLKPQPGSADASDQVAWLAGDAFGRRGAGGVAPSDHTE